MMAMLWSALTYGQDCVSFAGPVTFEDQVDTVLTFPIYNLDSIDLGGNQTICKVNIEFSTQYPGDILISLISPSGIEVILVGQFDNSSPSTILETTWDISFLPIDSTAIPDPGYSAQWNNNQEWVGLFFGSYLGSYYPNFGAFSNFNNNPAFGDWQLKITDGFEFHQITLHSFSIEFCNPGGIDCSECTAQADTLIPTSIEIVSTIRSSLLNSVIF